MASLSFSPWASAISQQPGTLWDLSSSEAFLRKRRREEIGALVVEAQLPLPLPPPGLGLALLEGHMRARAVGLVPVPRLDKLLCEVVGAAPLEADQAEEGAQVVRGAVGAHVLAVVHGHDGDLHRLERGELAPVRVGEDAGLAYVLLDLAQRRLHVLVLLLGLDANDEDAVELVAVVLALQFPRAVDLLVQPGRLQRLLDQLNVGVVRDAGRDLDDGVQVACGRANG